jgi:hydrogenase maturation protease
MKTLVLGLGNPVVSDDSVGLQVVKILRSLLADRPEIEIAEESCGGLRIMERLVGFQRAVIVDAMLSGAPPGTIYRLTPHSLPTQRSASSHDMNLATALALGRAAGLPLPEDAQIHLIGIEAEDVLTIGEQCTPAVAAAIPAAVSTVLELLAVPHGPIGPAPSDLPA